MTWVLGSIAIIKSFIILNFLLLFSFSTVAEEAERLDAVMGALPPYAEENPFSEPVTHIQIRDWNFTLPDRSRDRDSAELFEQLPPEAQKRFLAWRSKAIAFTAKALFSLRKPIGVATMIQNKLAVIVPKSKDKLRRWFGHKFHQPDAETDQSELEKGMEKAELSPESAAVFIAMINDFILTAAPTMAEADEEGLMFSVGLQAQMGAGTLGRGGQIMIDVFFGYNRKQNTFVMGLLPRKESFKMGASLSLGVTHKVTYYWKQGKTTSVGSHLTGTAFYSPGTPIGSVTLESGPGYAAIGPFLMLPGADLSGGAMPLFNTLSGRYFFRVALPLSRSAMGKRIAEAALQRSFKWIVREAFRASKPAECEQQLTDKGD